MSSHTVAARKKKKIRNPDKPLTKKQQLFAAAMQKEDPKAFKGKDVSTLTKKDWISGGGRKRRTAETGVHVAGAGTAAYGVVNAILKGSN